MCAAGRRVLMLVPEIALTPAVAATLRHTFGERVAIQHSALSEGERHDQWHRIRRGEVDVVVGTRSAVFAPLGSLGLVIVDEEHDTPYKQDETPRYHGRDVAIVRAQRAGAVVVLGSATPSLESFQNARAGTLRARVADASRDGPAARDGDARQHARRVRRRGPGRDREPRAAAGGGRAARARRTGGRDAQPPWLCLGGVVPRLCATMGCPNCSVSVDLPSAGAPGPVPLLRLLGRRPADVS